MENLEDVYELSPLQQGLLFHAIRSESGSAYMVQSALRLEGDLDAGALRTAFDFVIGRHGALRAGFVWEELEHPVQIVHRRVELPWSAEDWRTVPAGELETRVEALLEREREQGFDLRRPPLMRARLLRTGQREHRLVWCYHHLLLDGWSLPLVIREVFDAYEAFRQGSAPSFRTPRSYGDYIEWLQGQNPDAADHYWRAALDGVTAATPLGVDRALPATGPSHAEAGLRLSPKATQALTELARTVHVTLGTLVQGAWALVLARYSGRDDVVFGNVVSGRPPELPGVEETVGMFINTLPARVRLPEHETVGAWLRRLHADQTEARQHGHLPLVRVQRCSRVPAGQPLFESLLAFENFPVSAIRSPGTGRTLRVIGSRTVERPSTALTLFAVPGAELALRAAYRTDRFDAAAIQRLLGHLRAVLAAFAAAPDATLESVSLLDSDERERVLKTFNATGAAQPGLLHTLIEAQAARTPGAIAITHGGAEVSYRCLEARANRLANFLVRLGVGPEVRVGVCLRRTPELLVALLGVMKAGGAYVPLDPAYPRERLQTMLADSGARLLLTEGALNGQIPSVPGVRTVRVDVDRSLIGREAATAPAAGVRAENLAYVIYTSGSTGTPKGAGIPHAAASTMLRWMMETMGADDLSVSLGSTSVCFDVSVAELFSPLATGGRIVLVENALGMAELPADNGITCASMIPSAAAELGRMGAFPPTLRVLGLGGEPLKRSVADELYAAYPALERIYNLYGPTEDTTYTTFAQPKRGDAGMMPIGRGLPGTRLYVLDGALRPVAQGVAGELYTAGAGLARGYLGRPALTAERFLPDPFAARPGARMYRIGDLGRWRADGELECLGRVDFQVKVRGYRVELEEVEAALLRLAGVEHAVVVAPAGEARLVAYAQAPALSAGPNAGAALREAMRAHLPEYMVPAVVMVMERLPLTPNGKVNRAALPAPEAEERTHAPSTVRTPTEEVVAAVWEELLSIQHAGPHDSFFEAGGHSLLAVRLASRLREVFGVAVPLRMVFESATLRDLAAAVDHLRAQGADEAEAPAIRPAARPADGAMPLSFTQERFWFLHRMSPRSPAYTIFSSVRLFGATDRAALAKAFAEIVKRHEVLRSRFVAGAAGPAQVVVPAGPFPLPVEDLRDLPEHARDEEVHRLADEEAAEPFSLASGPLLRARLLCLGDQEHVLLVAVHHAVADGWSMGVLYRELSAAYEAFRRGEAVTLPALPVQYADVAVWQRAWMQGEVLEQRLGYWRRRLAGMPPVLRLPTDRPRPAAQGGRGAVVPLTITPELAARVRDLGREEGATLFMTLLSALQVLLFRWSGQTDFAIGAPMAGRSRPEMEGLIGCFLNTLVLRAELGGDPAFREVLQRARETTLDAYAHQDVPFERLVEELDPARGMAHAPLFQVTLVLQNLPAVGAGLAGLRMEPVVREIVTSKYDLTLLVRESAAGVTGGLQYDTDLFDAATAELLARQYVALLEAATADPERPIGALPLVSAAERAALDDVWGDADFFAEPMSAGD